MVRRSSNLRIAIGGIFQETSQFLTTRTELDLWKNTYIHHGDDLLQLAGTDCENAGMLAVCEAEGAQAVPLLAARCVSGGPSTDDCYRTLKQSLLSPLRKAAHLDGVLLALHGSMTAVSEDDPEGDLLQAVRKIVGHRVPVVATLDMHAHVTPRMVRQASGLVAFTHYPHDDSFSTGERAARLLFRLLRGRERPVAAMAKVPVLTSGIHGMTFGDAPMAHLTRRAREMEQDPGILSVSVFGVHPYNDLPGLGSGGLVISDNDPRLARRLARLLAEEYWDNRYRFECGIMTVAEAVDRGRRIPGGPVLLVDTADCTGGGAAGDSVALLAELIRIGVEEPTLLTVVDPEAAGTCFRAGAGRRVGMPLGYKLDPRWGKPLQVEGEVARLLDGAFVYSGGIYGGTRASMGPSAVLRIGAFQVLVTSRPTYEWKTEQFEAAGLDPLQAKFIGVKNPMNFNYAYAGISKGALVVDTPGPTPASVRHLPYRRMNRPFFPLDPDIPGLQPAVFLSEPLPSVDWD